MSSVQERIRRLQSASSNDSDASNATSGTASASVSALANRFGGLDTTASTKGGVAARRAAFNERSDTQSQPAGRVSALTRRAEHLDAAKERLVKDAARRLETPTNDAGNVTAAATDLERNRAGDRLSGRAAMFETASSAKTPTSSSNANVESSRDRFEMASEKKVSGVAGRFDKRSAPDAKCDEALKPPPQSQPASTTARVRGLFEQRVSDTSVSSRPAAEVSRSTTARVANMFERRASEPDSVDGARNASHAAKVESQRTGASTATTTATTSSVSASTARVANIFERRASEPVERTRQASETSTKTDAPARSTTARVAGIFEQRAAESAVLETSSVTPRSTAARVAGIFEQRSTSTSTQAAAEGIKLSLPKRTDTPAVKKLQKAQSVPESKNVGGPQASSSACGDVDLRRELAEIHEANAQLVSQLTRLMAGFRELEATRNELQKRLHALERQGK